MQLQVANRTVASSDGRAIIKQLGPGVSQSAVQQHHNTNQPSCLLFDLESTEGAASEAVIDLGEVCGTSFLACARIKLCWMSPYHSSCIAGLPGHIQFMLVQLAANGPYATILPLLPDGCKATLQPTKGQCTSGNMLSVHLDSGNPDIIRNNWPNALLIAAGDDPFKLVDASVAAAARVAGGAQPRCTKHIPDVAKHLGWCTWDAFYHSVSAQGLVQGLEGFKAADASRVPRWIIIDDGWQRTGLDHDASNLPQQRASPLQQQPLPLPQQPPISGSQNQHELQPAPSSNSSSSNGWLWHRIQSIIQGGQRAVLRGVSAVAGRLYWWSLLLSCLRQPTLRGIMVPLLKDYNAATSEHCKRLLSNEFNAKFSDFSVGRLPPTHSTASASEAAAVIATIKQCYNIKHVYAWHAILGYWSGVAPTATAAAPPTAAVATAHSAAQVGVAAAERAAVDQAECGTSSSSSMSAAVVLPRISAGMSDLEPPTNWSQLVLAGIGLPANPSTFLHQLHSYLAAVGIDGVKVDVQNQLELAGSAEGQHGGQELAAMWHAALEASAAAHFAGNQLINCMCHNTNNLYRMHSTALARVSDDFYPRLPASHTPHVAVCAFNSLFMGALVLPDWDMFHSKHPRALLHATARMISGGPVYVSDKPGHHAPALLARLALPGGLLLQPLLPGRPTRDCLFVDPCRDGAGLLKVWNKNPCGGVVAVFNLQGSSWSRSQFKFITHNSSPPMLICTVSPSDVEDLRSCPPSLANPSPNLNLTSKSEGGTGSKAEGSAGYMQSADGVTEADCVVMQPTGRFVLYQDSTQALSIVGAASASACDPTAEGIAVEVAAAGSDVITVAPLLQLRCSSSGEADGSSRDVLFAAIGLMNMLNPGGGVLGIASGKATMQDARRGNDADKAWSDGGSSSSDGRGSGSSSGGSGSSSWVVTDQEDPVQEGTATAVASTAPAAEALADDIAVTVSVLGCGQLLLYASCAPASVQLDAGDAEFSYSNTTGRLLVDIPTGAADGELDDDIEKLAHSICVVF